MAVESLQSKTLAKGKGHSWRSMKKFCDYDVRRIDDSNHKEIIEN